jgi:hypothetical protein
MCAVPPIVRFLLAQAGAFGLLLALTQVPVVTRVVDGWGWVALDAGLATALAMALRLPWWWWPLAAVAPVAVVAAAGSTVPSWAWAAALLLLLLIYGGGIATRVPLYLSNRAAAEALATLVPQQGRLLDLGCGLGGPLRLVAALRPDVQAAGVEASPLTWLIARILAPRRIGIRLGDLFAAKLDQADVVYAFLSPEPMPRLWAKAQAEMRPGTLLVSNTFAIPEAAPERTIPLPGRSDAALYVYRVSGSP